ncbi:MAG: hypothetical protein SFV21_05790 [Rhodospirillaceae bacterium]|nr:hypothetical protein [Rhodospirillaceae bacterium]
MAEAAKKPVKLPRTAKGKKPVYFDSTTDKLLSMVLTLMGELSVVRDRLDTVERLAEKAKVFKVEDIETYDIPEEVNKIRMERRAAYIARVLKCVQDELDALQQQGETTNVELPK